MVTTRSFAATAALLLAPALSCLRVGEPRAERDLSVGSASNGAVSVIVEGGLAAIRSIDSKRVHLWANAPELSIELRAPAPIDLEIENVLPDAEIVAAGVVLAEDLVPGRPPTKRVVRIPASGSTRVIVRAPDRDNRTTYRFAMYADVQERIATVGDIYRKMNAIPDVRFGLMVGDLTEHGAAEELEQFQRELAVLKFPVYATLGNHELGTPSVPYYDYFGRGSQSFVFRGVRFTILDSASATVDPTVHGWLDDWLALGRGQMHVVAMHIAPIDPVGSRSGSFASRNEANKLLAKLAAGRVDLTLYGHVHSYYAFSNAGIPAHISGGGGAIPERMDGIGRHFLVIDVDPPTQSAVVGISRVD